MDLYILRHGIAVERSASRFRKDYDRPLSREGKAKLQRITKAFRKLDLSIGLILASPYLRARQTAEIVAHALDLEDKLQFLDQLGAESNPRELVEELTRVAGAPERLLLVGHEPLLSATISLLVSGRPHSCVTLKKAGLCLLSVENLHAGRCAKLEWLLTPKQLLRMS